MACFIVRFLTAPHGETHVIWHKIESAKATQYSVVLPDLRGYGDSSKPRYSENRSSYSFRAMAQDQVDNMAQLGHKRFMVAGHDHSGRVAHRLCLDHPEVVEKVALLDIAPTLTMYNDTSKEFATNYVWWFPQIQPAPIPEHSISLDPAYYLRDHFAVQGNVERDSHLGGKGKWSPFQGKQPLVIFFRKNSPSWFSPHS